MPQPCTLPDLAFAAGEQIRDLGVALVAAAETETADASRVLDLARATVDRAMPLMLEAAGRLVVPWRDDAPSAEPLDAALLAAQHEFSLRTFGPGARAKGVVAHIRKELEEVEAAPGDLAEWVDVMILAADGAMRAGHDPAALLAGYRARLARNFARKWPDWRTLPADAPIEHDRAADAAADAAAEPAPELEPVPAAPIPCALDGAEALDPPCAKCDGAGWVWRFELGDAAWDGEADDTRYACPACRRSSAEAAALSVTYEDGEVDA